MYPPTQDQVRLMKQLNGVQIATFEELSYAIVVLSMRLLDITGPNISLLNSLIGTLHSAISEIENRVGEALKIHIRRSTSDPFRDFIRRHNI